MIKIVMIFAVIGLAAAVHHPIEHLPLPHHVDPHPRPVPLPHRVDPHPRPVPLPHRVDPHPRPVPVPLPHRVDPHPVPIHQGPEAHAEVISRSDDVRADGFDSSLKTSNNIYRSESGDVHGNIHGDFGWISPEGEHIDIKYVANELGYQPVGAAIPAVPDHVIRTLAWNEAHPHAPEVQHLPHGLHH